MANSDNSAESNYTWTQTDADLTITVPVERTTKGKDVIFKQTANTLLLGIKGQEPIFDGELFSNTKPDDSTWELETLDDGQRVIKIFFFKLQTYRHWDSILKPKSPKGVVDEDENAVKALLREWPALKDLDAAGLKKMAQLRPAILELNRESSRAEVFRLIQEINNVLKTVGDDKKVPPKRQRGNILIYFNPQNITLAML